jgi:type VI secretion system secreted protein VgrG
LERANDRCLLKVGSIPVETWSVTGLKAIEALSRPFSCEVELELQHDEPLELRKLPGQTAELTVFAPSGVTRVWNGVVFEAHARGRTGWRRHLGLRLGPTLELLQHTRHSRIFQDVTAVDAVETVLKLGGIKCEKRLEGDYCAR